jgi:mono/diheme cytochrome c family protein
MTTGSKIVLTAGLIVVAGAVAAGGWFIQQGFSAKDEPSALEVAIARWVRNLSVPGDQREAKNPVASSPDVLARARAHFADHCATCHGNDGSGKTQIGRNLYPKPPDLRRVDTQSLSDGELFYIIHNGIRFTGMPAWGTGPPEEDRGSWELVHFIRHLPALTPAELAEMKSLNPKTPRELEYERESRQFLDGAEGEAEPPTHQH